MSKTYSSIKEVLQSGILEQRPRCRINTNRRATTEATPSSSSLLSQSFTAVSTTTQHAMPHRHTPDTRKHSLERSSIMISENSVLDIVTVKHICLSSSPPPAEEIDLAEMTHEDLQRLKVEDPFMYYSIPQVHERSYRFENDEEAAAAALDEDWNSNSLEDQHEGTAAPNEASDSQAGEGEGNVPDAATVSPHQNNRRPRCRPPLQRATSCPAGMLANADIARSSRNNHQVVKKRRLSVEAHPNLVCEDLMSSIITESSDEERLEEEERFLQLLMNTGEEDSEEEEEDRVLQMLMMNTGEDGDGEKD
mmetsp:Transcript_29859/g.51540  ORF Transcript_29859/g.51540 Transcript_29859/m.51540 type:complete len:307 (-) Transcript_29859:77-997(-)